MERIIGFDGKEMPLWEEQLSRDQNEQKGELWKDLRSSVLERSHCQSKGWEYAWDVKEIRRNQCSYNGVKQAQVLEDKVNDSGQGQTRSCRAK